MAVPRPASSSSSRLWIRASPRGHRSGFAVLSDGSGGQVTITVLPKPWSPASKWTKHIHNPGETTHLVVRETQLVAIQTTVAAAGALAIGLGQVAREQSELLALGAQPDDGAAELSSTSDPFRSLIDLMLLAERGTIADSASSFEGAMAPSLVRLVAHERFLQLVEGLLFRARPQYSERTENLEVPRGRLDARSLLLSEATGIPRVTSTFDELTMDTPLLQVIASALRVIASDQVPLRIASLRPGLRSRAVQLSRFLGSVRLLDRERALLTAERLWLGSLDRRWGPAIDAALPVLRDHAVLPQDGSSSTEAFVVHVSTEKVWEQCLELALEGAFSTLAISRNAQMADGVYVPAPWEVRSTSGAKPSDVFPDFMFRTAGTVVVADAKYKLGVGRAPSSQDGYQLFAYSHLASLGGKAPDVSVILYPMPAGRSPWQLELDRLPDRDHSLWLSHLPFPRPSDLQTQASWSSYVATTAQRIRNFAVAWVPRGPKTEPDQAVPALAP